MSAQTAQDSDAAPTVVCKHSHPFAYGTLDIELTLAGALLHTVMDGKVEADKINARLLAAGGLAMIKLNDEIIEGGAIFTGPQHHRATKDDVIAGSQVTIVVTFDLEYVLPGQSLLRATNSIINYAMKAVIEAIDGMDLEDEACDHQHEYVRVVVTGGLSGLVDSLIAQNGPHGGFFRFPDDSASRG